MAMGGAWNWWQGKKEPTDIRRFSNSIVLNSGLVLFTPYMSDTFIGLYNPDNNIYFDGPRTGKSTFNDAVVLGNGNVVMCPGDSDTGVIGLYNPSTNTYTDGVSVGDKYFGSCVLLDDGRVLMTPYNYGNIGFYDPVTNTYEDGPFVGLTIGACAKQGKYVVMTYYSGYSSVYDSSTNTVKQIAGAYYMDGCSPTLDGRVAMAPNNYNLRVTIYNPYTEELVYAEPSTLNRAYTGAVTAHDGKVILSSFYGYIGIVSGTNYEAMSPSGDTVRGPMGGGAVMNDGRVIYTMDRFERLGIYDHISNTFTYGPEKRNPA